MIKKIKNFEIYNPIIIEGLPGMGNVGKIAIDFMIDSLKAVKIYEITSNHFPNCIFVNDKNIVEMPKIRIYHKKIKNQDFVFIGGDIQPTDENGCFEICNEILGLFNDAKEVVTLAGIGLEEVPLNPEMYITGTDKKVLEKYKLEGASAFVGPVIGISGVLVGLAGERKTPGTILLVQTFAHPTYLGIQGSRLLLKKVNETWKLGLDMKSLDKEVKEIEKEIKDKVEKLMVMQDEKKVGKEASYIG